MKITSKKTQTLLLAAGSCLFLQATHAENAPTSPLPSTFSEFRPQFYAGLSVGAQRLSGRRSEIVDYKSSPGDPFGSLPEIIPFSNGRSIANKNGYYSAHVGCTWNVLQTPLFWEPEIYVGQGNTKNNLLEGTPIDPALGTRRSLNASIQQSALMGGTLQVGVKWISNSKLGVLAGFERSQFEYKGAYIPRSQATMKGIHAGGPGPDTDFPVTAINNSKWLNGFVWGFSVEKEIESFRIGVDFRMIHYKEFKASYDAFAAEPETLYATIKPKNIRFGLKFSYVF